MNDSGINVVAFPTPRCVSSRTKTFDAGVYWVVKTRTRVKFLFTKFTLLFTIQIPQAEKYKSRFAASIQIGYEK
jgi:hypothetical protein